MKIKTGWLVEEEVVNSKYRVMKSSEMKAVYNSYLPQQCVCVCVCVCVCLCWMVNLNLPEIKITVLSYKPSQSRLCPMLGLRTPFQKMLRFTEKLMLLNNCQRGIYPEFFQVGQNVCTECSAFSYQIPADDNNINIGVEQRFRQIY